MNKMNRPQTIKIFLPDGSPTSIKEAEITRKLITAILFPRNKIEEVSERDMVHFTGVYFLFGISAAESKPLVYIGEGEDCFKRITSHNRKKDFWSHCVVVSSKTNEYTKADSKYLEHYCLEKAKIINRYKILNDTGSNKPSTSESREHDLLEDFDTLKVLLSTLGYPIFEGKPHAGDNINILKCTGKKSNAKGQLIDDGFLVYKGSTCVLEETPLAPNWVRSLRNTLQEQNILKEQDDKLVFQEDYIFNSPSAAAVVVKGRTSNGWTSWKNSDGKTLKDIKRI